MDTTIRTKRESILSVSGMLRKKRNTITLERKMEIIKRSERGETISNIGRTLGYSRSTVFTILKDKDRIVDHANNSIIPMTAKIITKQRKSLITEMEKLLIAWLSEQNEICGPIYSHRLIQRKAQSLYYELKSDRLAQGGNCDEEFIANRNWFHHFKEKFNLSNIKVLVEEPNVDECVASEFSGMLERIIEEGDYSSDQIFNVDEASLFWKKLPEKVCISKDERNVSNDRLMFMIGSNASGDLKLKPLLLYYSINPKGLHNIIKASLPVIWRANSKAWITTTIFEDWFFNYFVPAVECYCLTKNIPFKILLIIDSAPGHPSNLDDLHPNIKVIFLPPNIAPLLLPMDQGVIEFFKACYFRRMFSQAVRSTQNNIISFREFWTNYNIYDAIKNIADSWDEIKQPNMKEVWNELFPQFTDNFQGSIDSEIVQARQAMVDAGHQLQLSITDDDVLELLEADTPPLTHNDLMELEQQIMTFEEEEWNQPLEPKKFVLEELAEALRLIELGMAKLEEQDPNTERFTKAYRTVSEGLNYYKITYDEKKRNQRSTPTILGD